MDFHHQHPVVFESIDEVVSHINDGDTVALGGFWLVRIPVALVDALIKRGVKDLTVLSHCSGLALDQLIAANLVKKVIFSFSSMDIFGLSPFFRKAIENKQIEWEEWTALRMVQALDAGRQNLPSFVMHPPYGTDFLNETEDFKMTNCPFSGKQIGVMRSLQPDVLLIHAQKADEQGNIQFQGSLGMDRLMIGAAKQTFVSVEEIVPVGEFTNDPRSLIIPHFLINRISKVPGGAYPSSCMPYYITDYWHLSQAIEDAQKQGTYEKLQKPSEPLEVRLSNLNQFVQVEVSEFEHRLKNHKKEFGNGRKVEDTYTIDELMAVVLAEQISNNIVSTVGSNTPLSMVAYLLAKKTHAPNTVLIPFTGLNDISFYPITLSFAEVFAFKQSTSHWAIEDLWQWIYEKSLTSIEFGSTAQVDQFGRINNSLIGSLDSIKVRLPGQAGLADVANLHHNFYLYITRQDRKRMVKSVDFVSGCRQLLTKNERIKVGLPDGLSKVVTNLGIFELDRNIRKLILTYIHPGIKLEEVEENTGFELIVSDKLQVTTPPTQEQLNLIRNVIDPFGFRKLEFSTGKERNQLIKEILEQEQLVAFNKQLITN